MRFGLDLQAESGATARMHPFVLASAQPRASGPMATCRTAVASFDSVVALVPFGAGSSRRLLATTIHSQALDRCVFVSM